MKLSTLPQRATDLLTRMENAVALRATKHLDDLEDLVVQLETGIYAPAPKDAEPTKSGATPA